MIDFEVSINSIVMGSGQIFSLYAETDFSGTLSELNIWSTALSNYQMIEITKSCGNETYDPMPNLLKWSEVEASMITGVSRETDSTDICYLSVETIDTIVPVLLGQNEAIQACQSLKAKFHYPHHLEKVNGKQPFLKKITLST